MIGHRSVSTAALGLGMLALAATATPASASYTVYTDHSAWLTAIGVTPTLEDFEGTTIGGFPDGGGLKLDLSPASLIIEQSAPGAASTPKVETVANGTKGVRVEASRDSINGITTTITLPESVAFFGAFFDSVQTNISDNAGGVNLVINGITLGPIPDAAEGTMDFFGVVADSAAWDFTMITLDNAEFTPTTNFNRQETFQIDNAEWAARPASSVPEPASLAILGLGFVGLGAARRRRSA